MKIHKKAIQELFISNDKVLDAEQVLELGGRWVNETIVTGRFIRFRSIYRSISTRQVQDVHCRVQRQPIASLTDQRFRRSPMYTAWTSHEFMLFAYPAKTE